MIISQGKYSRHSIKLSFVGLLWCSFVPWVTFVVGGFVYTEQAEFVYTKRLAEYVLIISEKCNLVL